MKSGVDNLFRTAINDLIKWKFSKNRKPLITRGARQVGKTWLMKEFGKTHYKKVAYINFDNNERMEELFKGNLDIKRIVTALQIESGVTIEADDTLIIFDEVQEVPRALTSLKYFCENAPEYHIISAASLLGVALHPGTSFPVGKVDFLYLYPMDFLEFLTATGNENLVELLKNKDTEVKAQENLQAKSLKSYCQKYSPKYAIRTSMSDFRQEDWLINIPLYAVNVLTEICK